MSRKTFDDVLEELKAQEQEIWRLRRACKFSEDEKYRKQYFELIDKRNRIKDMRSEEPWGFSFARGIHDTLNSLVNTFYRLIRPLVLEVPPEEARQNMHDFILKEFPPREKVEDEHPLRIRSLIKKGEKKKKTKPLSLEDKIQKMGEYYISYKEIITINHEVLWPTALKYDWKGIIARPTETLPELIYRGNSLLYLSQRWRERSHCGLDVKVESKNWEVQLETNILGYKGKVSERDIQLALRRLPYHMDLSWFPVSVKEELMAPALGITFILPHYNGIGFIQMLPSYKSRDKFIEILSHELVHAGTVYLDSSRRDYLETKAYHVGRGTLLGEYTVATNQQQNIVEWVIMNSWGFLFPWLPVPKYLGTIFPKARAALHIAANTGTFHDVQRKLTELYGQKGNYLLGRLMGDEIEEFHYTNDIPARMVRKDSLKWQIMKANFETLA